MPLFKNKLLRCSFCSKPERDVLKLIAGPNVYICNECIGICNDILFGENIVPENAGVKHASRKHEAATEHNPAICALINAAEYKSAARLLRNAAVFVVGGLLDFGDRHSNLLHDARMAEIGERADLTSPDTYGRFEIGMINAVLQIYPDTRRPLQETDKSHVILRPSLDGATVSADDATSAFLAFQELVVLLGRQIDVAIADSKARAAPNKGA